MIKKILLIPLFAIILSAAYSSINTGTTHASFDSTDVISDSEFDNTNTMTASDIDTWLNNNWPHSCISTNNGFSSPEPTGYNPTNGFTYGGNVSAGTVIATAAQTYGINPQVLISTLQKESSVVTGTASYGCQYINTAMGYGCPDSGSCPTDPATESGFSKQVIHAAWLFKFGEQRSEGNTSWDVQIPPNWDNSDDPQTCYGGPMTQGYFKRCSTDASTTYFDGYITIDGVSTHMDDGATAAMYWYTPHFSGNENFVTIFENTFGFGDTQSGYLSIAHPNGTLVRPDGGPNSNNVYLLVNGGASFATSPGVLQSWGYSFANVKLATQGDLNLMAASDADTNHVSNPAPLEFRPGSLVKGSGPTVYVIQSVDGVNYKDSLVDWNNFTRLGYNFSTVITVPDTELSQTQTGPDYTSSMPTHPDGSLVRAAGSPTVYYILPCDPTDPNDTHCHNSQEAHSMTSLDIFTSDRFSFSQVETATTGDMQLINDPGWAVTWFADGTLIKGSGPTVYVISLDSSGVVQSKRSFATYYNFVGLGYTFNEVMQVNDSELPAANGPDIGQ